MMNNAVRFREEDFHQEQQAFMMKLSSYLEENTQLGSFLALLEAGSALNGATSALVAAIEDYPPQQWSVLLKDSENLAEVAPYLVNLRTPDWYEAQTPLTRFSDWLFANPNFADLGVFFVSQAPFMGVKAFWQRFARTHLNNKNTAYFRFYNPRFFDSLIKNIGKQEYQSIATVVNMIIYFDYFNPHIMHVFRFFQHGFKKEQYDLKQNDYSAFIQSLFV